MTNGSFAGDTAVGGTVHVYADYSATSSQLFDHWTGDTQLLSDPLSWHATFVRPATAVNLTAVFSAQSPPQHVTTQVNGTDFLYSVPSGSRALLFLYTASGCGADYWFAYPETYHFVREAMAAGYGVAALSCADQVNGWAPMPVSTANVDIQNTVAGLSLLQQTGLITASTPIYTVGTSLGGRMTVRAAYVLGWKAVVNYVSQGDPDTLMRNITIPVRFNMRVNDGNPNVSNATAQVYSQAMTARGVLSEFQLYGAEPLVPKAFMAIAGVDSAASTQIYTALATGAVVDARGYLTLDPTRQRTGWEPLIPGAFQQPTVLKYIEMILDAAYAEHGFFASANHATLAFFAKVP